MPLWKTPHAVLYFAEEGLAMTAQYKAFIQWKNKSNIQGIWVLSCFENKPGAIPSSITRYVISLLTSIHLNWKEKCFWWWGQHWRLCLYTQKQISRSCSTGNTSHHSARLISCSAKLRLDTILLGRKAHQHHWVGMNLCRRSMAHILLPLLVARFPVWVYCFYCFDYDLIVLFVWGMSSTS